LKNNTNYTNILLPNVLATLSFVLDHQSAGSFCGNATSKGTEPAMPLMIVLTISVKAVMTAGDKSSYTSLQFSCRNTFIWLPATKVFYCNWRATDCDDIQVAVVTGWPRAVAYPGFFSGGGSTNSVENRENGDLGVVAP